MSTNIPRNTGKRNLSLGYMRMGDVRQPATVLLQIMDANLTMTELIELDPKQFVDLLSGLAVWVDDGFANLRKVHDDQALIDFATWLSEQTDLDVDTPEHAVQRYRESQA